MNTMAREVVGYAFAAACALLVDMAILWTLVHFFSWGYLAAATVSFMSGTFIAYEMSVRFAFTHHRLSDRRTEFLCFAAIGTLGLAVNTGVIFIIVNYAGLHYLLAKCIAAICTFSCNFVARRQILFAIASPATRLN